MKRRIEEYQVNDVVDVFPNHDDIFDEFTGRIIKIDNGEDMLLVVDQDDDVFTVHVNQIELAYNHDEDPYIFT